MNGQSEEKGSVCVFVAEHRHSSFVVCPSYASLTTSCSQWNVSGPRRIGLRPPQELDDSFCTAVCVAVLLGGVSMASV